MRKMRRALLPLALAAFVLAAVLASAAGARSERAAHSCFRAGELRFHAADGTKLVGHRLGKGTTAVILAHQSEGDLCDWVPYARRLAREGYFVFPIDFRGYGFSQDRTGAAAERFAADLAAAAKALREARQEEDLPRRRLDGRARLARRGREREARGRRRRQRLVAGALPRHGRGRAAPAPRAGALPRRQGDDNAGFDFSEDAERCTRDRVEGQAARVAAGLAARDRARRPARPARRSLIEASSRRTEPRRRLKPRPGSALLTADGEVAASSRSAARRRVRAMRAAGRARRDEPVRGSAASRSCCRSWVIWGRKSVAAYIGLLTHSTCLICSKVIERLALVKPFDCEYAASVPWLSNRTGARRCSTSPARSDQDRDRGRRGGRGADEHLRRRRPRRPRHVRPRRGVAGGPARVAAGRPAASGRRAEARRHEGGRAPARDRLRDAGAADVRRLHGAARGDRPGRAEAASLRPLRHDVGPIPPDIVERAARGDEAAIEQVLEALAEWSDKHELVRGAAPDGRRRGEGADRRPAPALVRARLRTDTSRSGARRPSGTRRRSARSRSATRRSSSSSSRRAATSTARRRRSARSSSSRAGSCAPG